MPSSTFNSRDRIPGGWPWRPWVVALAVTLLTLAGLEAAWRHFGIEPSVLDDKALWCMQRDRLRGGSLNDVALVGASRIMTDFVPGVFDEICPGYRLVQLAIDGAQPMATIRDLARDASFRGTVLYSVSAAAPIDGVWEQQEPFVRFYREEWGLWKRTIRMLRTALQRRLCLLAPDCSLPRVLPEALRGIAPAQIRRTSPDRFNEVHFDRIADLPAYMRKLLERTRHFYETEAADLTPDTWAARLPELTSYVKAIQDRGGAVVFIRFPTSGAVWEMDEAYLPKAQYWDRMARECGAPAIHFKDVPTLRNFTCPEGSHLQYEDAVRFTKALVSELQGRGILN